MSERKIVFTNGCFDLFHAGHLHILKEAKKLGTELHVGINSDKSICNIKGTTRPIIRQDQRFEIVSAIKYVDQVYIFDEDTPLRLIRDIQPDIIVKGSDYNPDDVIGGKIAKVITIPLLNGISTTKIIKEIRFKYDGI